MKFDDLLGIFGDGGKTFAIENAASAILCGMKWNKSTLDDAKVKEWFFQNMQTEFIPELRFKRELDMTLEFYLSGKWYRYGFTDSGFQLGLRSQRGQEFTWQNYDPYRLIERFTMYDKVVLGEHVLIDGCSEVESFLALASKALKSSEYRFHECKGGNGDNEGWIVVDPQQPSKIIRSTESDAEFALKDLFGDFIEVGALFDALYDCVKVVTLNGDGDCKEFYLHPSVRCSVNRELLSLSELLNNNSGIAEQIRHLDVFDEDVWAISDKAYAEAIELAESNIEDELQELKDDMSEFDFMTSSLSFEKSGASLQDLVDAKKGLIALKRLAEGVS